MTRHVLPPLLVLCLAAAPGCAALRGYIGYPDADLAALYPLEPGQVGILRFEASGEGPAVDWEERVLAVRQGEPLEADVETTSRSGRAGERERTRVRVFRDRVEVIGSSGSAEVHVRTPLRVGTRWKDVAKSGWVTLRRIEAIEDVCTARGAFHGALKIVSYGSLRPAGGKPRTRQFTRWIAKGFGEVRTEVLFGEGGELVDGVSAHLADLTLPISKRPFAPPPCGP